MDPTFVLFVIGFAALIKGADWLVDGAASFAGRLGVSSLMIGLTIVAVGTSSPELVVNLFASAHGNADLAIGNVIGSNIANLLLILGISAAIYPLSLKRGTVWKEIPFSLLGVVLVAILANDTIIDRAAFSSLTRIDGLVLLSYTIFFFTYVFGLNRVKPSDTAEVKPKIYPWPQSAAMMLGGLLGLMVGGRWIVDGAIALAASFGVSESLIGLAVIAIGTSLPELATSAVAAYKHDIDIAVGNVIGSNILNVFWILGLSSVIRPLPFSSFFFADLSVAIGATLLLIIFMMVSKKHVISRWHGVLLVVLYVCYLNFLFFRG